MTHGNDKIVKGEVLSFSLKNDLAELDRLHSMIEGFGHVHQWPKREIFETNLVLEEIFTNIVSYGHKDNETHNVLFSLGCSQDSVTIQIEDDGVPFNLLEAEPVDLGTDLEQRSVGGLGIHLVRKLMNDVTYKRINAKNVVNLRKDFKQKGE